MCNYSSLFLQLNQNVIHQVRDAEASWRDTRKQLRKDPRYDLADALDREEKEKLFEEHIKTLGHKNKDLFHKLLDDTPEVKLTSRWKEVKKIIKDDPRYAKFSSSDRVCRTNVIICTQTLSVIISFSL